MPAVETRTKSLALPTLRTARLSLRAVEPKDAPALQRIYALFEVATMTEGFPHPYPEGEATRWIQDQRARSQSGAGGALAVALDGETIGHVSLRYEPADDRAEINYAIDPARWGVGYATEAVSAVVRWALETGALHRIYALVYATNVRSIRVLHNAGFRLEGRLREHALHLDRFEDDLLYGVIPTDLEQSP